MDDLIDLIRASLMDKTEYVLIKVRVFLMPLCVSLIQPPAYKTPLVLVPPLELTRVPPDERGWRLNHPPAI